jgi:hydroxymethylpyrimidine pyrophosphatase-like HAD family hydrolase
MVLPEVIAVDLDGTLVDSRGRISKENQAALAAARAAGIEVVIATGRTWSECRTLLDGAGVHGAVITAGGSRLVEHPANTTLDVLGLPQDVAQHAAEVLIEHGLGVLLLLDPATHGVEYVHVGTQPLHPVSTWWHERHGHAMHVEGDPHEACSMGTVLRVAAIADAETFAQPVAALKRALGDGARVWHWEALTDPALGHAPVHLLEVFDPGAGKWAMLQRWCASIGRDPERIAAFGDGLNDVELVQRAPLGIAMGNADARVLAVADHVAPSHDDHGVAMTIDAMLRGSFEVST